ncbi:MAG: DNA-binding protein [Prevotella sp.]|nr:DNA-binding protein [Prevotella sp.]
MAIFYRLVCDGRKESPTQGKWFARAVNLGTVETDELARIIERNCSVKRSDVLAVLTELGEVIHQQLQDSHRIRLKGIGSLMVGISNRQGADRPEAFRRSDIKGLHLCFKPEKEQTLDDTDVLPLPRSSDIVL